MGRGFIAIGVLVGLVFVALAVFGASAIGPGGIPVKERGPAAIIWRAVGAACMIAGVVTGTPLIITGQITLVLLDQRDVLVEIRDELKDHGPPSAADRFLTRRTP